LQQNVKIKITECNKDRTFDTDEELDLLSQYTTSFMKRNKLGLYKSGNIDVKRLGSATTAKRDFFFGVAIPAMLDRMNKKMLGR